MPPCVYPLPSKMAIYGFTRLTTDDFTSPWENLLGSEKVKSWARLLKNYIPFQPFSPNRDTYRFYSVYLFIYLFIYLFTQTHLHR